jgi:hypothetical protein
MREETRLTEDVTAVAANIEKFHAGFSATLLGLEEDGLVVLACGARLVRPWERRVRTNVLSDTCGLTSRSVQEVAENTG